MNTTPPQIGARLLITAPPWLFSRELEEVLQVIDLLDAADEAERQQAEDESNLEKVSPTKAGVGHVCQRIMLGGFLHVAHGK